MKKTIILSCVKKMMAGFLIIAMLVAGIAVYPKQVDAAVVEDKVIYVQDSEHYNIKKFWDADSTKRKTPVKEGYVFGGWFRVADVTTSGAESEKDTGNYYAPLTETELNTAVPETAYAKFVPAKVLSVKAQNSAGIDKTTINSISKTNPMFVRVMSSLDSANYQKVGFDIYLGNWIHLENTETSKIYDGIMVGTDQVTAESIFGGVSDYVSVWQLSAIDTPSNAGLIIYVRPYWVTTDGTKVKGLAKYVHIEDDYMNYISVPVNLLGDDEVAAGAVDMTYDNADLQFVGFEKGRILPEMNYHHDEARRTIKMVGNTDTDVDTYKSGESIYANVRFVKPSVDTHFNMELIQFCDWSETVVPINGKWDVEYDVTETASE